MLPTSANNEQEIRILIADDHSIFRDGLKRLLETDRDFRVVGEATNGAEALDMIRGLHPDVLLLDLRMPRLSGLDVLRRLSKTTQNFHTILLAASIEKSEIVEGLLHGAHGIVSKESSSQVLFQSIRTVMKGELWLTREMIGDLVEALRGSLGSSAIGRSMMFNLTRREIEIIGAVAEGHANKDIAKDFGISEYTVKHHLTRIFDKIGVTNRIELATFAMSHDLLRQFQNEDEEASLSDETASQP